MATRWYPSLLFSLIFSFGLSACGFQLGGHTDLLLPFHTLCLETNQPYSNFIKELQKALEAAGVHTSLATTASARLEILAQNYTRTATSLGNAGQTTTYLLTYSILFQIIDCKNHVLLGPQSIQATRTFSITSNQLAGDLNTENELHENMQKDVIQQLLIRLASPKLHQQLRCSTCPPQ